MREVAAEVARIFRLTSTRTRRLWIPNRGLAEALGVEPSRWDRHAFERRLAAEAEAHRVRFAPVVDFFVARQSRGPFHLLPRDFHCNPVGYELTAELLAEWLIDAGWLREAREPAVGASPNR